MKKFPQLSDAVILHQITQPQAKIIFAALRVLDAHLSLENPASDLAFVKSQIQDVQESFGFKFSANQVSDPRSMQPALHQMIDALSDAYTNAHEQHIRIASEFLHTQYEENFDPDVFNLPQGETLRIAGHEYI